MRRNKQETDTKRLLLRKFHKEDVKEFYQIVRKHEVGKWLGLGKGMTYSESEDYLNKISDHWASHSFGVWAVTNKMNKDMIGHCGLRYINDTKEIELIYLLDPEFWGQGIATEAGIAVIQYAFHCLNVNTLFARVRINNNRSKNVINKLGFTYIEDKVFDGRILSYYKLVNNRSCH